jgi:3-phosphoshikimate 1-carboxyvinyltransferase
MKPCLVKPVSGMGGRITLPGDKSIAHRAVILSALSSGKTTIDNIPFNNDLSATVAVFRSLGVDIKYPPGKGKGVSVTVKGAGARGLQKPVRRLNAGESGTTMRLLAGLLCAQDFASCLSAGRQLSSRPMSRVTIPLRLMGAVISGKKEPDGRSIRRFRPAGHLHGITYRMPVLPRRSSRRYYWPVVLP